MPVTDPEYKRQWMRDYRERLRAAKGPRNTEGRARIDGGKRRASTYHAETRRLSLDAIAWMSRKRRDLMDVYQYASGLPVEWWAKKDGYSIDEIIRTLRLEIECAPK